MKLKAALCGFLVPLPLLLLLLQIPLRVTSIIACTHFTVFRDFGSEAQECLILAGIKEVEPL